MDQKQSEQIISNLLDVVINVLRQRKIEFTINNNDPTFIEISFRQVNKIFISDFDIQYVFNFDPISGNDYKYDYYPIVPNFNIHKITTWIEYRLDKCGWDLFWTRNKFVFYFIMSHWGAISCWYFILFGKFILDDIIINNNIFLIHAFLIPFILLGLSALLLTVILFISHALNNRELAIKLLVFWIILLIFCPIITTLFYFWKQIANNDAKIV